MKLSMVRYIIALILSIILAYMGAVGEWEKPWHTWLILAVAVALAIASVVRLVLEAKKPAQKK